MAVTEPVESWLRAAWVAIEQTPGGDELRAFQQAWIAHAALPLPVVTIFGAFDAGKSSLLKRLLFEANVACPDWLTVSARRETFEVGEVEAHGAILRDSPGISGGNASHEQIAREACVLSDAYIVVVPPQLFTGEKADAIDLLGGRYFSGDWPASQRVPALVVIARMDEAGVDPEANRDAFEVLRERKRAELRALLSAAGIPSEATPIFAVVADPFQLVQNRRDLDRAELDGFREWDGIAELGKALSALPAQRDDLRMAAGVRFAAFAVSRAVSSLSGLRVDRELAREALQVSVEKHALAAMRLAAMTRSARARLDGLVQEVVLGAVRRASPDLETLQGLLQGRLKDVLIRWFEQETRALADHLAEVQLGLDVTSRSPSFRGLEEMFAVRGVVPPPTAARARRFFEVLHRYGPKGADVLESIAEARLGMPLKKAAEHLQKLKDGGGDFAAYAKSAKRAAQKFATPEDADKARDWVKYAGPLVAAVPVIAEAAGLAAQIAADVDSKALAQQRTERRTRVRETLDELSVTVADSVWADWWEMASPAVGLVAEAEKAARALDARLAAEIATLDEHLSRLNAVGAAQPLVPV